jgi:putative ABC transport system permease protein
VVDTILAEEHGLALGDIFEIKGQQFEVVGLSAETRSWMAAFIFVTDDAASLLSGSMGTVSFILVQTDESERAAVDIESATGLLALDPGSIADQDREVLAGVLESPVRLMILIAFSAGTLVIALTAYSGLVDRIREYGIVKAMGAGRMTVTRIVLGQTMMLAIVGTAVGYAMYLGGAWLVSQARPQFWFALEPRHLLVVFGGSLVMAVLAAILPARQVARLDPATVYRGW